MVRRPTMANVARLAGVSKMTVSRVINQQPNVSEAARAQVLNAIESLGYVPSQRARSLAVGQSNLLGLLVLNIVSEWVWPLILGVGQAAEKLGYQILLRTTGPGEVASFDTHRPLFGSDLVDGLIIVSWRVPITFARELVKRNFPVVLIDAYVRPQHVNWVSTEDRSGAQTATTYLADLGHRRIGFIGGGEKPYLAKQRLAGFLDGLTASGLTQSEVSIVQGDFTRESGYQQAQTLLRQKPRPTAIFAANDLMAVGVLDAAHELGLSLPGELSIMGFDNTIITTHVNPALTTIARPYQEMGGTAVQLLVETITTAPEERQVQQRDLPTELIVRQSTAPPRPAVHLGE